MGIQMLLYILVCTLVVINIGLIVGIMLTTSKSCEVKKNSRSERIVGGSYVSINAYPYFACLIVKGHYNYEDPRQFGNDTYICGSSIIGRRWLITAAHCLAVIPQYQVPLKHLLVRSGTSAWKVKPKHLADHHVKNYVIHEFYDSNTEQNDIALIQIKDSFKNPQKAIKLAGKVYSYNYGLLATVMGFGWTNFVKEEEVAEERFKSVNVKITKQEECTQMYIKQKFEVNEKQICAGWPEGGRDACTFDSGGPLVRYNVLIGIVSYGKDCGLANYPGIYTRVGAYQDWIQAYEKKSKVRTGATFVNVYKHILINL